MAKRPESAHLRLHHRDTAHPVAPVGSWMSCHSASAHRTSVVAVSATGRSSGVVLTGFLLISLGCLGCATVSGEKYTYKTLPSNYIASVRENPQTIDLSRLASSSTKSSVLDHGDVIELSISAGLNEKDIARLMVRIENDGFANIPQVGRVQLAGMELEAAEAVLYSQCVERGLYRNPNITMTRKSQRTNRITVAGAVKKPSTYELPRGQCDLLGALSKAEGLDPSAGTQVVIRNPGASSGNGSRRIAGRMQNNIDPAGHSVEHSGDSTDTSGNTVTIDLVSVAKNGTGDYHLEDGAVVYVEKRDPEPLHVMGLVMKPGRFEFPIAEELRVLDAIALAGGISSILADKVFVIRRKPGIENQPNDPTRPDRVETFVIKISLANAKQVAESNIRLSPGDMVSVEQSPATFFMEVFRRVGFGVGTSIPLGSLL